MSGPSQQLGNTLWAIADQLRGAMNADNFPDSGGLVGNHQGEINPLTFCLVSYGHLQSHLGQARIRSILNQSQSILMLKQLTVSKDKRIALRLIAGRMGVQKLGGHGDVCN